MCEKQIYSHEVLTHTIDELQQAYLTLINKSEVSPGIVSVKECSEELIVGVTRLDDTHQRPGGIVSGPTLFSVVDTIAFLVTLAHSPKGSNGFTSAVSMHFLEPARVGEIRVEGRLLKYGKKSCVVDALVFNDGQTQPAAQAVVTYSPIFP
jgi:uncharacterized protein (TIGR00369 family)